MISKPKSLNEYIESVVEKNLDLYSIKDDKINIRCPFCGDSQKSETKKRGWIYLTTEPSFYCWNCSTKREIVETLALIANCSEDNIKSDLFQYNFVLKKDKKALEETKKKKVVTFETTWKKLETNEDAKKVISKKRLHKAPFVPKKFQMFYDEKSKRIVMPWLDNGKIIFWQKRAIYPNQEPKYSNAPDVEKPLFGIDNIDNDFKYIFLTEGLTDSVFVKNCLAIGGCLLTDYQKELLSVFTDHTLVYLLNNQMVDNTARVKYEKILTKTSDKVFLWPKDILDKDVNDYVVRTKQYLKFADEEFLVSNVYDKVKGLLKLKFNM